LPISALALGGARRGAYSARMKVLDEARATAVERLCEAIVPGSSRVKPVVYVDAVLAAMPSPQRDAFIASVDALADTASRGSEGLRPVALTPEFLMVRALCVEAFYSDFVAPDGGQGPSAYEEIGFNASPLAARVKKDWSYLGVVG
jgi:hypothetical protein